MRAFALALLLAFAPAASGALHVTLRQTLEIERAGATAAFAVDPDVAEVSVRSGVVTITGRHAGDTLVTVISRSGVESWPLVVEPLPPRARAQAEAAEDGGGSAGTEYDSETARLTSVVDFDGLYGAARYRLHATNVTFTGSLQEGWARTTFPALSLEVASKGRTFVLFDEAVRSSPLTLDGSPVRGIHFHAGRLALHAGATAATLFEDVLLPSDSEKVIGASYRVASGRSSFTPGLYVFPSESTTGGARGVMASLLFTHGDERDPLRIRAEAGWGGAPGGAFDLSWRGGDSQLTLGFLHLPAGIASIGIGRPHGTFADAAWSGKLTERLSFSLDGGYARHELPGLSQTTSSAAGELRARAGKHVSVSAGAWASDFQPESGAQGLRSLTLPLGVSWDSGPWGVSGTYRYQRNSATNLGGHGGRLSVRHGGPRFFASAFVDLQRDVPTLELVFRQVPELERIFAELGIVVKTPEDVARVLRENPALAQLGYVEGVTLRLDPSRVQAGGDVGLWLGGESLQRLKLHLVLDRASGIDSLRETRVATLSYTRRVADLFDVTAGYSVWQNRSGGSSQGGSAWLIGIRKTFDGPPRLPFGSQGTVEGVVRREDTDGRSGPAGGVEVRLDGARGAITDERGHFAFAGVERGAHRVEVVLPSGAGTYFTTPSSVVTETGRDVAFGLAFTTARLLGSLRDDEGTPVAGVPVRIVSPAGESIVTTDGQGLFRLAGPDGTAEASLPAGTLPAGYEAGDLSRCSVTLARDVPSPCDLVVKANRSLGGSVAGAGSPGVVVRLLELEKSVPADGNGAFLFRNLPSGTFTVVAEAAGRRVSREVTVGTGPATVRGIDLAFPSAPPPVATSPPAPKAPDTITAARGHAGPARVYSIHVSSYRERASAERDLRRVSALAGRQGFVAEIDLGGKGVWHRVMIGAFSTREEAQAARDELAAGGIREVGPVYSVAGPEAQGRS